MHSHFKSYSLTLLVICLLLSLGLSPAEPFAAAAAGADPSGFSKQAARYIPGQLSGVIGCIDIEGNYAYVCQGSKLLIYDVASTGTTGPVFLAETQGILPAVPGSLDVSGGYAYLGMPHAGLVIVDVSNYLEMPVTAIYQPQQPDYSNINVRVEGSLAYLLVGTQYMEILDISDPGNPVMLSSTHLSESIYLRSLDIDGSFVYLPHNDGMLIWDASNPSNPFQVEAVSLTLNYSGYIVVENGYAYIESTRTGVYIVDVQNPSDPQVIGTYTHPGGWHARKLFKTGNTLLEMTSDGLVYVLDVQDPTLPVLFGSVATGGEQYDAAVYGTYAVIACNWIGLCVIDLSDPSNPVYDQTVYIRPSGIVGSMDVQGDFLYFTKGKYGFGIADMSNPAHPEEVGAYPAYGTPSAFRAGNVDVDGSYAYLGTKTISDGISGLRIFDISNPTNPMEVSFFAYVNNLMWQQYSAGYMYAVTYSDFDEILTIIDVSDPSNPTLVTAYHLPFTSTANYFTVDGDYVYFAHADGVFILDITDKSNPTLVGNYTDTYALDVEVQGNLLYVPEAAGLTILDVTDKSNPVLVGQLAMDGAFDEITFLNSSYAFASNLETYSRIDISDPANPSLVETHDLPADYPTMMMVSGSYLLIADAESGVVLLPAVPSYIEVNPLELNVELVQGELYTDVFTVTNTGENDLTFSVIESVDWLSLEPLAGSIDPAASQPITVTFDATTLMPIHYTTNILVNSSDPGQPQISVPVFLNVLWAIDPLKIYLPLVGKLFP